MALQLKDRVLETASAPGTGTVTLLGASLGYQSFNTALTSGNTTYYAIADLGGANWEVGIGTFTSPNQLARNTILESSAGGSAVNFSSGIQNVFVTYPAEKSVNLDASDNVSPLGTIASGTWNATAIGAAYGGTGRTTLTLNNVILGNGTSTVQFVAPGTALNVLTSNGTTWTSAALPAIASPDDAYFLSFMMG
jgi:FlaG/FlaF family flagellin (archaellin)